MQHSMQLTRAAAALMASGAAFHRRDGEDPLALLTKTFGEHTEEVMKRLGASTEDLDEVKARLADIEQKAARMGRGGNAAPEFKSWGEQVFEAENVKNLRTNRGVARVQIKGLTSVAGSGGAAINPDFRPDIVARAHRRLVVRDLIAPGQTTSGSVEFVRQTGYTNNAAPVAEGALKPESQITLELAEAKVRTIAHWISASRQVLDDAPMLQSFVDGELRYGVDLIEDRQMLFGDGTGQNLFGMVPQATAYDTSRNAANDTRYDTLLKAISQAEEADYPVVGIVLNTSDWFKMMGTKDAGGNYIGNGPLSPWPQTLWNLAVVYTNAMPAGRFLTGGFNPAVQVFDRMETEVEISTEDSDNFRKNLVTIRAEKRTALAVKRPEALVTGTFPQT